LLIENAFFVANESFQGTLKVIKQKEEDKVRIQKGKSRVQKGRNAYTLAASLDPH
jgi:hypothetical protein